MPNVISYNPNYLNVKNLSGGYFSFYDQNFVQIAYSNRDSLLEIQKDINPILLFKIANYGTILSSFQIIIDDTIQNNLITIDPSYSLDVGISNIPLSTVSSYSVFNNTQQIYDYISYYHTTSSGIIYDILRDYSSTSLNVGDKDIILIDSTPQPFIYDANTFIIRTNNLSGEDIITTGNITVSGNSTVSNIGLCASNVYLYQNSPRNLSGVFISGNLIYNNATNISVTYNNSIINNLINIGAGIVSISAVNSDIVYNPNNNKFLFYSPFLKKYITNIHITRIYGYFNDLSFNKIIDPYTTLSESQVTSIATIFDLDYLYDAATYWTIKNAISTNYFDIFFVDDDNLDFLSNNIVINNFASTTFSYISTLSTVIIKTPMLSSGQKFKGIKTLGSVILSSGDISNINVYTNVYEDNPVNLTGVNITGSLIYNTSASPLISYYDSNINYIDNLNPDGIVVVRAINSTININQ